MENGCATNTTWPYQVNAKTLVPMLKQIVSTFSVPKHYYSHGQVTTQLILAVAKIIEGVGQLVPHLFLHSDLDQKYYLTRIMFQTDIL